VINLTTNIDVRILPYIHDKSNFSMIYSHHTYMKSPISA